MTAFFRILYCVFFVNILSLIFILNSIISRKVRESFIGRLGWYRRYKKALLNRGNKKRIWFHVSSVGELEQAKPLMRLFHERNKEDVDIILTYFSPSAHKHVSKIDYLFFSDYLPLDTYLNTKKLFSIIDPKLIVFVKFDVWPNIVWEAKERGIPAVLIDATLHRKSMRYSNIMGQSFYSSVYMSLSFIGAVSERDLNRFLITAPKHRDVKILGDTRFDQVAFRAQNSTSSKKLPDCMDIYKEGVTLICGSTWEGDDRSILTPLKNLLEENANLNLVLVPHEPTEKRVSNYLKCFSPFNPNTLSQIYNTGNCSRVTIIDSVGVLAELYKLADIAYIGGAFSTGVHNVMEPAIMGLPVLFGPFYYNSPEAEELIKLNCAFSGNSEDEFYSYFKKLILDTGYRKELGIKAKSFVESNMGADKRYYNEILRL